MSIALLILAMLVNIATEKKLLQKTSFKIREEKNRKEKHPRLKLNSNSDKTITATPVPVRVYNIYRACSWSWSLLCITTDIASPGMLMLHVHIFCISLENNVK